MKKRAKLISFTLSVLLLLTAVSLPFYAAYASQWRDYRAKSTIPSDRISERVIDEADLLTDTEETALREKLDALNTRYGYDVVIATTESLEGYSSQAFADDCYDYNGFSEDGILFLVSIEDRDWAISTCGDAIYAFTDSVQDTLFSRYMKSYLSRDDWYNAFDAYADQCAVCIENYINGNNSSDYDSPSTLSLLPRKIFFALVVGIIAGLAIAFMKMQKNNRKMLGNEVGFSTVSYIDGNVNIIDQYDKFLRNEHTENFVKTESSSSNHSSTHTSSSGRTHGGSSGKF